MSKTSVSTHLHFDAAVIAPFGPEAGIQRVDVPKLDSGVSELNESRQNMKKELS